MGMLYKVILLIEILKLVTLMIPYDFYVLTFFLTFHCWISILIYYACLHADEVSSSTYSAQNKEIQANLATLKKKLDRMKKKAIHLILMHNFTNFFFHKVALLCR